MGSSLHPGPGEQGAGQLLSGSPSTRSLYRPGLTFPSGLMEGGSENTRDQSSRGRALSSPVLSFWSLSFHDPFSRRICDLSPRSSAKRPSGLIYSRQAHTPTPADSDAHTERGTHAMGDTWPSAGPFWYTLLRQHGSKAEPLNTHKATTWLQKIYVSTCTHVTDTGSPTHSLDFRHTKTPTQ